MSYERKKKPTPKRTEYARMRALTKLEEDKYDERSTRRLSMEIDEKLAQDRETWQQNYWKHVYLRQEEWNHKREVYQKENPGSFPIILFTCSHAHWTVCVWHEEILRIDTLRPISKSNGSYRAISGTGLPVNIPRPLFHSFNAYRGRSRGFVFLMFVVHAMPAPGLVSGQLAADFFDLDAPARTLKPTWDKENKDALIALMEGKQHREKKAKPNPVEKMVTDVALEPSAIQPLNGKYNEVYESKKARIKAKKKRQQLKAEEARRPR